MLIYLLIFIIYFKIKSKRTTYLFCKRSRYSMADSDAKYSLWLMPDRNSHQWDLLRQTIEALRKDEQQHGKPPPVFVPHLTLLGSVSGVGLAELKEKVETLAHSCGGVPLRVWLHDLGKGSTFHQCVFIHARKTPEVAAAPAEQLPVFFLFFFLVASSGT
jgi:hypothetical protein